MTEKPVMEIREDGGWTIIRPDGDLLDHTNKSLCSILSSLLEKREARFRLDLRHVEKMEAVSLNLLYVFGESVRRGDPDGKIEVINANEDMSGLFTMTPMQHSYVLSEVSG